VATESAQNDSHEGNLQDPAVHTLPQSGSLRPQTKCRVQIYSLSTHQVVKTLDDLDSEESLEVTGIQSNDRVIALVNICKMLFRLQKKMVPFVAHNIRSR
jgi:hypothetical protein